MFEVRPEVESDREAIYDFHLRAFGGRFEPELVGKIRAGKISSRSCPLWR